MGLLDQEARDVTRSYTQAVTAAATAVRAWRNHHATVARVYERGRTRVHNPVTEQDIATRLNVTRQSVSRWVQRARSAR